MADLADGTSTWDTGTSDSYTAAGNGVGVTEVVAERVNGPAAAILGLQSILGSALALKGSLTNLSTRLAVILAASGGVNGGTAFPTSPTPTDGQLFWRTDLKQLHLYDGALAQWQRIDGVNDHGLQGGLADNDHTWAARLASGVSNALAQFTHANTALRTITLPDASFTVPQDALVAHLAGAETLSGPKTLTAPLIADFTNAQHDHLDADDGGTIGGVPAGGGIFLQTKIIDIGDWNMDTTMSVSIAHGLTVANIRKTTVTIRDDQGTLVRPLEYEQGGSVQTNSTEVVLVRTAAGPFDSTLWDATSFNRGWIVITYV